MSDVTAEAAVAALSELVPPPERPTRPDRIDWTKFERENGFAAPLDYRLLLERYGVGEFGTSATGSHGWLYLLDPFDPEHSLLDQSEWERRNSRGLQRQFPDQYPGWPMWPEPGGLLPWGGSIDGDLVGWWTTGVPNAWGTRFFGHDCPYEQFRFGIAEFIVRLYRGELETPELDSIFGPLEPENERQFFAQTADARRPAVQPRESVTVRFAGLSRTAEERQARSEEHSRRFTAARRPADDIFDAWKVAAVRVGLSVEAWGARSAGDGDPLHHHLELSFEPALEPAAKRAVAELSQQLGVAILDVHNLDHDRIWKDIARPNHLRLVR